MGRGDSKISRNRRRSQQKENKYESFMKMSDDQKVSTIQSILNDQNITVPDYLDKSPTSKVMYALGMNNKPKVVSDDEFDNLSGDTFYRTVRNNDMQSLSGADAINQIKNSDYTSLSSDRNSGMGRALYFTTNFGESYSYGGGQQGAAMMRVKVNPDAKIVNVMDLNNAIDSSSKWSSITGISDADVKSLYAISHGIDGWNGRKNTGQYSERAIINRAVLTVSDTTKDASRIYRRFPSWKQLADK